MQMTDDHKGNQETKRQLKTIQKLYKIQSFSPLDELGINYDPKNEADVVELNKLVGEILNFPSTQLAKLHSQAMKLGNYDLQEKENEVSQRAISEASDVSRKCPCCGFTRQIENIKLSTSMDDIKNIGTSTYLYFSAYKHLGILLLILGLCYSIFAIVTNVIASKAQNNLIAVVDYISISISAKQLNKTTINNLYYYIQCWIGLAVMCIWIFVFVMIKYFELKGAIEYDNDTSSISDYSVVIEGMPLDITQEELQVQLDRYYDSVINKSQISQGHKRPLTIAKINRGIPFYLNESELADDQIRKIENDLAQLRIMFIQWVTERQSKPTFTQIKEERDVLYKKYTQLSKKRLEVLSQLHKTVKTQLKEKKSDQLTTVFVTFQTNVARDLMISFNQTTFFSKIRAFFGDQNKFVLHRGQTIYNFEIRQAPQPEDIIWSNIGLNNCSFYGRKFFTFTITLILLGACFGIVIVLSKKQQELTLVSKTDASARYLSITISIVVAIVNVLLSQVINLLTNFERNYTTTNRQTSLAVKSIIAQMINSILIPVIVAHYIKDDLYNASGLVDNIFMMSITSSLIGPVLVYFDPLVLVNKLLRCIRSNPNSKLYQSQRDHNKLYLGLQFQVGSQYIYLVNLFMFVCYFVSLQPICVFFALFGYMLMYWAQKYCIFYRYRRPVPGSDLVNEAAYQIIMFGPLLYSLGSLTWANFIPGGEPKQALLPNLIALGISVLILVLPLKKIIFTCFFADKDIKVTKYEQMRISFSSQYDRMNPSTQEEGIDQYTQFCQNFNNNINKLSVQKQEELRKKIMLNTKRGQLQQQASQPGNFSNNFGIEAINVLPNILNQPIFGFYNAYNPRLPTQKSPLLMFPQLIHNANPQSSARILQNEGNSPSNNGVNLTGSMMGTSFNPLVIQQQPVINSFNSSAGRQKDW